MSDWIERTGIRRGFVNPPSVPQRDDDAERARRGEISYMCSFWHHGAACDEPLTCGCECHRAKPWLDANGNWRDSSIRPKR